MTKFDLAIEVAKRCNISIKQSDELIDAILDAIRNSLSTGEIQRQEKESSFLIKILSDSRLGRG